MWPIHRANRGTWPLKQSIAPTFLTQTVTVQGSPIINDAGANFQPGDVGSRLAIAGAGGAAAVNGILVGAIISRQSVNQVTLNVNAAVAVANARSCLTGQFDSSDIAPSLAAANIAGPSVRFAWMDLTDDGLDYTKGDLYLACAVSASQAQGGRPVMIRVMNGQWCPNKLFAGGGALVGGTAMQHYVDNILVASAANNPGFGGQAWVPTAFNGDGTNDQVFLAWYAQQVAWMVRSVRNYNGKVAPFLRMGWPGRAFAELSNQGPPGQNLQNAPGYSATVLQNAHNAVFDLAAVYASENLLIEHPVSGAGPLDPLRSQIIAHAVNSFGPAQREFFVFSGNGWSAPPQGTAWPGVFGAQALAGEITAQLAVYTQAGVGFATQAQFGGEQSWPQCFAFLGALGCFAVEVYSTCWSIGQGAPATTAGGITALNAETAKFATVEVG